MKDSNLVKISFAGDLMCLKEQNDAIMSSYPLQLQKGYDDIFIHIRPMFEDSDLLIGNLETPVCSSILSEESISFNSPKEFARAVANCGFGFVSTSNNHCLDRGVKGLEETVRNLDDVGIDHSGTYITKEESDRVFVKDLNGLRVAIICSTFGTNSEFNGEMLPSDETWRVDLLKRQNKPARVRFNTESASGKKMITDNVTSAAIANSANRPYIERYQEKIKQAKTIADLVFVLPHIGGQYNPYPGTYTRHIAELTANLNPSYVVCNHPHVPHYIAQIKGVPVAFSLGNFSFTPDTGYYIPNSLAEYGVVLHTYWDPVSKDLQKSTFTIVKNIVGDDGISRVYPVSILIDTLTTPIEKERLSIEVQAVANRVASRFVDEIYSQEIELNELPALSKHAYPESKKESAKT